MKLFSKILITTLTLATITSCELLQQLGSPKNKALTPVDYLEKAPKLDIKNFFTGDLEGFAILLNSQEKIDTSFTAKINGKWEENRGTVQYNYLYNGGKKDSRTWLITIDDSSSYSAIGHDFIETAQGRNQGNASIITYTLNAMLKEQKQRIEFEDQLYLVDEKSAIIISTMRSGNNIISKAIISLKKIN
ncbi:MAG: DUF3833 family protein [Rickettsiales bacterium]|nr:DUF3833 family protein [Rickettsiales bacterium]